MRSPILVVFTIIMLAGQSLGAQDQVKVDSLELRVKNAENDSIKIQGLIEISLYYRSHDNVKAVRYAQQAASLANEKEEIALEQKAERQLFAIFFNTSDFKSATVHDFKALKLYEITKDSVGTLLKGSHGKWF